MATSLHVGAGRTLTFPLNHTRVPQPDAAGSIITDDDVAVAEAYFVTPAAHIGRVVTGVVLVTDPAGRTTRDTDDVAKFGLAAICFADRLAEQGYKVLLIESTAQPKRDENGVGGLDANGVVEQAALFLRQKQDIQRVGLLGVGIGADQALQLNQSPVVDCAIAMCPSGVLGWEIKGVEALPVPTLVLTGDRNPIVSSDMFHALIALSETESASSLRMRLFPNQHKGFAFSHITEEDAATQAIAEILDWLVIHLHRFRVAAGTSDGDPWWPQGRNGPFCNVGLARWQDIRTQWTTPTQAAPPRPPPVPSHLVFDGLSSLRRTFDLPQRMRLGDVIELFVEIWDVQQ